MFYNTTSLTSSIDLDYYYKSKLNVFFYKIISSKTYKIISFFSLRNNLQNYITYLKIKIKLHNKKFSNFDIFSTYNLNSSTSWRYMKTKKRSLNNPKSLILKNRRILRYVFNNKKISSKKLNLKLITFYKHHMSINKLNTHNYLGFTLLNLGLGFNISDVFYLLKTSYVKLNNKITKSFFVKLAPNDLVNVENLLFLTNFSLFYKLFTSKWLKRKRKKITSQVRKYINLNKSNISPSKILSRWLSNSLWYSFENLNCEIDYRIGTFIFFYTNIKFNDNNKITSNFLNIFSILNLWYYNY